MPDALASIPLSALRSFEAAARLSSFTRAADELGVSQAAVSWQVKALERRLGQALFLRLPREVALTAAGERLARASTEAMGLLRAALADVTDTGQGVLVISTLQSLASQWLAPRLGAFQLANPRLAVRLETTGRLVDLVRENVDVALRHGRGDWPGLTADFLFSAALVPVCAPEIARDLQVERPEDLLRAPRIGTDEDWAVWFASMGMAGAQSGGAPRLMADLHSLQIGHQPWRAAGLRPRHAHRRKPDGPILVGSDSRRAQKILGPFDLQVPRDLRRADRDQGGREQEVRGQPGPVAAAVAQRDIHVLADQVDQPAGGLQAHGQARAAVVLVDALSHPLSDACRHHRETTGDTTGDTTGNARLAMASHASTTPARCECEMAFDIVRASLERACRGDDSQTVASAHHCSRCA